MVFECAAQRLWFTSITGHSHMPSKYVRCFIYLMMHYSERVCIIKMRNTCRHNYTSRADIRLITEYDL